MLVSPAPNQILLNVYAYVALSEDGVLIDDNDRVQTITWDALFHDIEENYLNENGLLDPEEANEVSVIAARLRRLADRLDKFSREKAAPRAV